MIRVNATGKTVEVTINGETLRLSPDEAERLTEALELALMERDREDEVSNLSSPYPTKREWPLSEATI